MVQGMASLRSERIILIIIKRTFLKCYNKYYGQSKRLQDVSCIVCFGRSIYYKAI